MAGVIWKRFTEVCEKKGGRPAVTFRGIVYSYNQTRNRAESIAAYLATVSDWPKTVAIFTDDPFKRIQLMLGSICAGAAYWVIPDSMPAESLAEHLDMIKCRTVLATGVKGSGFPDGYEHCAVSCDDVLESSPHNPGSSRNSTGADADSAAAYYLTSGSTGRSRFMVRNHRQIMDRVDLYASSCGYCTDDRFALVTHPGFIAAEGDVFGALLGGSTLCLADPGDFNYRSFSDWLRLAEVSVFHPPVSFFEGWKKSWTQDESFPHLRKVILGGERFRPSGLAGVWSRLADKAVVFHRYSSTESGPVAQVGITAATALPNNDLLSFKPFSSVEVRIVGDNEGVNAEEGELLVRSPFLSASARTDSNGFYQTGDRVKRVDDSFSVIARMDGVVKVRGYRVYLPEVESALLKCSGVCEAAVIKHPGSNGNGESTTAFLVSDKMPCTSEGKIREELKNHLCGWQIPGRIRFIDSLPRTETGKIKLSELRGITHSRTEEAPGEQESGKIQGFHVVSDLQELIALHPDVERVIVVESDESDNAIVAFIKPVAGKVPLVSELKVFITDNRVNGSHPQVFRFVRKLPTAFEIDSQLDVLRRHRGSERVLRSEERPVGVLETQLLRLFSRALGIKPVGRNDDFFMLGGDSLLAMSLCVEIESFLGTRISIGEVAEFSTARKLARFIGCRSVDLPMPTISLSRSQNCETLYLVPGRASTATDFIALASRLGGIRTCISIEHRGMDQRARPALSVQAEGRNTAELIRKNASQGGKTVLLGFSYGGLAAYEAGRLLARDDCAVHVLIIDIPVPSLVSRSSRVEPLRRVFRDLRFRMSRSEERGRWLELIHHQHRVNMMNYKPLPTRADVTVFQATTGPTAALCSGIKGLGWAGLCHGKFRVRVVESDHLMVFPRNLDAFVPALLEALER